MTTGFSKQPNRYDKYLFRLVHYQPLVLLVLAASDVLGHYLRNWATLAPGVLAVLAVTVVCFTMRRHDRAICLACSEEFPLDAAAQANGRLRPALRRHHLCFDRPVILVGGFLAIGVIGYWVWWAAPVMWVLFAAETRDSQHHRMLELYCPYCRDDDGDDEPGVEPVPTPDPAEVGRR